MHAGSYNGNKNWMDSPNSQKFPNPADYVTRLSDLEKLTTWCHGPDYLQKGQEFGLRKNSKSHLVFLHKDPTLTTV